MRETPFAIVIAPSPGRFAKHVMSSLRLELAAVLVCKNRLHGATARSYSFSIYSCHAATPVSVKLDI